jgi:hypothetical protein
MKLYKDNQDNIFAYGAWKLSIDDVKNKYPKA